MALVGSNVRGMLYEGLETSKVYPRCPNFFELMCPVLVPMCNLFKSIYLVALCNPLFESGAIVGFPIHCYM